MPLNNKSNFLKHHWLSRCSIPALLVLAGAVIWLGYFANRSDFGSLLSGYTLAFFAYLFLLKTPYQLPLTGVIVSGVVLRFLLLFGLPLLSDDVYRFIWDGRLSVQGIHPFAFTPEQLMQQGKGDAALFGLLNSPRYFTVYPPVNQAIFWLAATCSPGNVAGSVLVIKSTLFLGELGTLWCIYRLVKNVYPQVVLLAMATYALNPLLIVEVTGNVHFEGMMAGCLVAALLALRQQRPGWAGVWWAVSVAVKLLPVLMVPLVLGWLDNRRDRWRFMTALSVTGIVLFLPLFDPEVLLHLAGSVKLYFQQFEFNASLYYLFSHISPWFTGWYEGRTISIVLAEVTVAVTLGLSWKLWQKQDKTLADLQEALLAVAVVYLLNATTVHPWYVMMPLILSIGTRYFFPVIWSGVVVLSYSHYHRGAYLEQYGYIALEYLLLAGAMYGDWQKIKKA